MAYTYHENWAFTSSLPLPMVYEALTMNQPDLAAHLHKAMQLEEEHESSEDLITTQWQTPPQYGEPLALQAPTAGTPLMERNVSMGAVSIHGGDAKAAEGDNEVIDFDTLFCYKRQDVSEQQLENLEMGGGPAPELMQVVFGTSLLHMTRYLAPCVHLTHDLSHARLIREARSQSSGSSARGL